MEHDADRNFPHSKNESNSPTVDFEPLNNQLRKGAWLQRSFTLSTTSFSHSAAASCRDHFDAAASSETKNSDARPGADAAFN
jgi:hypothetical protein